MLVEAVLLNLQAPEVPVGFVGFVGVGVSGLIGQPFAHEHKWVNWNT